MTELLLIDEMINNMPPFRNDDGKEFKIKFDFGTKTDLNKFITLANRDTENEIYPLIYCETPYEATDDLVKETTESDLTFIIAMNNDNLSMSNKTRLKFHIIKILDSVYKSFFRAIEESISVWIDDTTIDRTIYFGFKIRNNDYSSSSFNNEDNEVNANWDAVSFKLRVSTRSKNNCNN